MHHVQSMLQNHPKKVAIDMHRMVDCMQALEYSTTVCTICADACLSEDNSKMFTRCIRLNLDCADICRTTENLLARQSSPDYKLWHSQLNTCVMATHACAEECDKHAQHESCRNCADICRQAEESCRALLEVIGRSAV